MREQVQAGKLVTVLNDSRVIVVSGVKMVNSINEYGEIIVNCYNETNIEGIFAAGDVSNVPEKQIIIAAGEGAKAALTAFRYLVRHKFAPQ